MLRYANLTTAELQDMLTALVSQLGSGVASISYNGQTITYSSIVNIEAAISGIERELANRTAREQGYKIRKGARYPSMPGKGFV